MTNKNSMTFGKKITALRRAACMTQEELGFSLCVSRQTIAQWEADSAPPKADKIVELCKLFHVSADYLLFDEVGQRGDDDAVEQKREERERPLSRSAKVVFSCGLGIGIIAFLLALLLSLLLLFDPLLMNTQRFSSDFNFYAMLATIVGLLILSATSITLSIVVGRKANGQYDRPRKNRKRKSADVKKN